MAIKATNPKPKAKPKTSADTKKPVVSSTTEDRPKLKGGRTHSGAKAAEIVIRPILKMTREETDTAVVAWGRMNPPTKGHERLVKIVNEVAADLGACPMLFLSPRHDTNNPLDLTERVALAIDAFGEFVHVQEEASVKDPITLLKYVAEHFDKIVVVTGQEHENDYLRFFSVYNGTEFVFEEMDLVVVERDTQSTELQENISATQMRQYVVEGNREAFERGLPDTLQANAGDIFTKVWEGLAIDEVACKKLAVEAVAKLVALSLITK